MKFFFGKGGMKVLVDIVVRVHTMEARAYEVGVDWACLSIDILGQKSLLWPSAMKFTENGEYSKDALLHADKSICQNHGLKWSSWYFISLCLYYTDSTWGND